MEASQRYCTFWIDKEFLGVPLLEVKEVNKELKFTKIFHAKKPVRGFMNVRGKTILVLDLRVMFDKEPIEVNKDHSVLLLKDHVAESCGLLVENVEGVLEVPNSSIESHRNNEIISSICKLDEKLMSVVNNHHIVTAIQSMHARQ